MKILLTGASGFLGKHLSVALLAQKHQLVHAIGHYGRDSVALWMMDGFFDAVIHCAGIYGRDGETATEMLRVNTLLTVELFEAAQKAGVKRFIYTNTTLPSNLNAYALSKSHAADWLQSLARTTAVINLEIQHMYGPGAGIGNFVESIFRQCLAHKSGIDLTLGEQQRDFIYISDVVSAIICVLQSQQKRAFTFVDVGTGETIELRLLVEMIARLTESRSKLNFGAVPYRVLEPMLMRSDLLVMRQLGWSPAVRIEEGLRRTLAALKETP